MNYHRLNPPVPLETPKGFGWAYFLVDGGLEHDDYWKVLLNDSGEWWTFPNSKVRGVRNYSLGRKQTTLIALDKTGVRVRQVRAAKAARPAGPVKK